MLEVEAVWKKRYQVEVMARQFQVNIDEPHKFSGEDTGMMPTELFLSSIASCFCLALVYAAKNKKIKLDDMTVKVLGETDIKSFTFTSIIVKVISSLPQKNLEEIIALARKYCFVSNAVTKSCPIEYEVTGAGD
ncbi:MAG: OsmC family protein [Deltaproteobacteria bacterium]